MSEIPELRKNQIGVSCKTIRDGQMKANDEMLYFTIGLDQITIELYPEKPIIIIDKDAIKMILEKIDITEIQKVSIKNLPIDIKL